MKLLYKFFLAFFVTNLAIVFLLLMLIDSQFTASFERFVEKAESEQIAINKVQLIEVYKQNNSWLPIINDVQIWRDIVDPRPESHAHSTKTSNTHSKHNEQKPELSMLNTVTTIEDIDNPADFLKTGRRLSLYDSNKQVIVGNERIPKDHRFEAIVVDDIVIGWLGLRPAGTISESPASEFLKQLHQNMLYVGAITLSLAFLVAWLLSQHLTAPVRTVVTGTQQLMSGNYKNRITKTTHDEIGKLSDDINNLAETLEKSQESRFQWMSDTSHELRTPLTVLKAQIEAIQDGLMKADAATLKGIVDEINALSKIVDDVHQLSNSESGALTYKKEMLNPAHLLKNVADNFKSKLLQKSLHSDYPSLASCRCFMLADESRLIQLFTNILENSYRYTDSNGDIKMSATVNNKEKCIVIYIDDSSPGVSQQAQQKLFDRFYRVEQSRNRSQGGSGLGLSLCQQIVEAHQGNIEVSDSLLGGIRITITFPLQ